jgi:hypothetical protein
MDDDEITLQPGLELVSEVHGRHPGPAMQEKQHGIRAILAPDENPLIHSADPLFLKGSDTSRSGYRRRPAS